MKSIIFSNRWIYAFGLLFSMISNAAAIVISPITPKWVIENKDCLSSVKPGSPSRIAQLVNTFTATDAQAFLKFVNDARLAARKNTLINIPNFLENATQFGLIDEQGRFDEELFVIQLNDSRSAVAGNSATITESNSISREWPNVLHRHNLYTRKSAHEVWDGLAQQTYQNVVDTETKLIQLGVVRTKGRMAGHLIQERLPDNAQAVWTAAYNEVSRLEDHIIQGWERDLSAILFTFQRIDSHFPEELIVSEVQQQQIDRILIKTMTHLAESTETFWERLKAMEPIYQQIPFTNIDKSERFKIGRMMFLGRKMGKTNYLKILEKIEFYNDFIPKNLIERINQTAEEEEWKIPTP